jgi:phosphoserine phosphatase
MNRTPRFDAVCFDCDSTLSGIEGIDELARRVGCEAEVAALTEAAMNGDIPLEEIYGKRLDIVRPDKAALAWLADRYVQEMVSGAVETMATLRRHGKAVYVVTSGLFQPVAKFANTLGFASNEVYAVRVHLDAAGAYKGFESSCPLCRGGGKAFICRKLVAKHGSVVMVGDGVTDLAARDGGAYVVGYGGVIYRNAMLQEADCYISAPLLSATLATLLTDEEKSG